MHSNLFCREWGISEILSFRGCEAGPMEIPKEAGRQIFERVGIKGCDKLLWKWEWGRDHSKSHYKLPVWLRNGVRNVNSSNQQNLWNLTWGHGQIELKTSIKDYEKHMVWGVTHFCLKLPILCANLAASGYITLIANVNKWNFWPVSSSLNQVKASQQRLGIEHGTFLVYSLALYMMAE